jgi:hypothetical protein
MGLMGPMRHTDMPMCRVAICSVPVSGKTMSIRFRGAFLL